LVTVAAEDDFAGDPLDANYGTAPAEIAPTARARVLLSALLLMLPATASRASDIAGFGDSITCTLCNDGSYLLLLENYLEPDPIIEDHGTPDDTTDDVLFRLDAWIDSSNTADVIVLLSGTNDIYRAVGGFGDTPYVEADTVNTIEAMLDLVLQTTSMPLVLVAPPPVQSPCGNPVNLTCGTIDSRLDSLSTELGSLAASKSIPFVDLYGTYKADPRWSSPTGSPNSLFISDGVHPKLATGDDLNAMWIANAIAPTPVLPAIEPLGLALLAALVLGIGVGTLRRGWRVRALR
jgi:lysophospholipase L1-like esterase